MTGVHTLITNKVCDLLRDHTRLSAASAREYQQRAVDVLYRSALAGIQIRHKDDRSMDGYVAPILPARRASRYLDRRYFYGYADNNGLSHEGTEGAKGNLA